MVNVPAVLAPLVLRVDAGDEILEEGGRLHRYPNALEGIELGLLEDVVDTLQLRQRDVVLEGEGVESVRGLDVRLDGLVLGTSRQW